jgi:hypothetical protein
MDIHSSQELPNTLRLPNFRLHDLQTPPNIAVPLSQYDEIITLIQTISDILAARNG